MANEGGEWIMKGLDWDNPYRIRSWRELINWINEGADLNARLPYLSTFMGHGSMNETEYYIHILPENLVVAETIDFAAMESIIPEADDED